MFAVYSSGKIKADEFSASEEAQKWITDWCIVEGEIEEYSGTYTVAHRNGSGGLYSDWYTDASGLTFEEAQRKAREVRREKPSSDGWNAHVAILSPNGLIVGDYY